MKWMLVLGALFMCAGCEVTPVQHEYVYPVYDAQDNFIGYERVIIIDGYEHYYINGRWYWRPVPACRPYHRVRVIRIR